MKLSDLTDAEYGALARMMRAPALWPFAMLVARVGFSAAVEVCQTRASSPLVREALEPSCYTADDLPSADDVLRLVVGVRVMVAAASRDEPLQTTAKRLGYILRDAQRGLLAVRSFARPGLVTYAHRV